MLISPLLCRRAPPAVMLHTGPRPPGLRATPRAAAEAALGRPAALALLPRPQRERRPVAHSPLQRRHALCGSARFLPGPLVHGVLATPPAVLASPLGPCSVSVPAVPPHRPWRALQPLGLRLRPSPSAPWSSAARAARPRRVAAMELVATPALVCARLATARQTAGCISLVQSGRCSIIQVCAATAHEMPLETAALRPLWSTAVGYAAGRALVLTLQGLAALGCLTLPGFAAPMGCG